MFVYYLTCSRLVLTFEMFLMVYTCSDSELLFWGKNQSKFVLQWQRQLSNSVEKSIQAWIVPDSLQFGKASHQCICVLSETADICTMILLFLWDLTKKNILLLDDGRFRSACYNQRKIMQQCVAVNMLCDLGNPTCLRHMIWLTLPIENPSQI